MAHTEVRACQHDGNYEVCNPQMVHYSVLGSSLLDCLSVQQRSQDKTFVMSLPLIVGPRKALYDSDWHAVHGCKPRYERLCGLHDLLRRNYPNQRCHRAIPMIEK